MSSLNAKGDRVSNSDTRPADGFLDVDRCLDVLDPFRARWRELATEAEHLGSQWMEHPNNYYCPSGWYLSPVRFFGIDNPDAMAAAPVLSDLVARDSRVMTAQYLCLAPGATVASHRGTPMGMGRFHLGLSIPDGCVLHVGDQTREWIEGEWLAFDDVWPHSTSNLSDRNRIVLSLDLEHPAISLPKRAYLRRHLEGSIYEFLRRSPRTLRAIMWFNRRVRARLWPLEGSS